MESKKTSAKDFFLNLGAIVALYTVIISVLNLLFTVINNAYPQVTSYYYYGGSQSISFPVATLIIVFPIFVLLMWLLQKGYTTEPEKRNLGIRKWLMYITLFIAGIVLAGDLVTVLYYFLDGQEMTTGFLLKVISVFVVTLGVFLYYISDIKNTLTAAKQKIWLLVSALFLVISIIWGFSVLGSPQSQRLLKYDEQKINDIQNLNSQVQSFFQSKGYVPSSLDELKTIQYGSVPIDPQTGGEYEYHLVGQSAKAYELCAVFNTDTLDQPHIMIYPYFGAHPAGRHCFQMSIDVSLYPPIRLPMN